MKARIKETGVLIDVTPKTNINAQHMAQRRRRRNDYACTIK